MAPTRYRWSRITGRGFVSPVLPGLFRLRAIKNDFRHNGIEMPNGRIIVQRPHIPAESPTMDRACI
jgi:hypothetical protein